MIVNSQACKILGVGDAHTKIESIRDIESLAEKIVAQAHVHKPDFIVIFGDLADSFEKIHILCLNAIVHFFAALQSLNIQIYYIVGNHDCLNNQVFLEDLHVFNAFKRWKNIVVIDKPTWIHKNFLLCPYTPPGRLVEALEQIDQVGLHEDATTPFVYRAAPWPKDEWKRARAILCHQEFRGAQLGSIVSKHGDVWQPEWPQVITGHIHEYGKPYENVLQIGAPRDVAFGDKGDKTISLLEFGPSRSDPMRETRIDLQMPRKVTLTLSVGDAKNLQLPANASIRLHLVGTSEELADFKKTKKYAELKANAKIIPKVLNPASDKKGTGRATYLDLLRAACADEHQLVREAFDELTQSEKNESQTRALQAP